MTPKGWQTPRLALTAGAAAATLAIFEALFRPFFPVASGEIAGDYAYYFPHLYDGALWFHENGLFARPWFTPSFCGGLPAFPNPQSGYYAMPQLLDLLAGPMFAVHATVLAFAAIGYGAMYLLARRVFACGSIASSFASALFALDGFYLRRMIAGHLGFHPFTLIPLIAWCTLRTTGSRSSNATLARDASFGGIAIAYALHAGAIQIIAPMLLSVIAIALLRGVSAPIASGDVRAFVVRFIGAIAIALGLAAGKLASALAFLGHNPRALYPVPGVRGAGDLVDLFLVPLIARPDMRKLSFEIVNTPWKWNVSEFEIGVGPMPMALLIGGGMLALAQLVRQGRDGLRGVAWRRAVLAFLLALMLVLPLAINVYSPAFGAFVKEVPLLRSSHTFFRFLSIDVPVVVLASSLVLDRVPQTRARFAIATIGLGLLLVSQRGAGNDYGGGYSPRAIEEAHARLRATGDAPPITSIGALSIDDDAGILAGRSVVPCYEPMFGYLLETFPKNALHAGSVGDVTGGAFNLLDPTCFVFPDENRCAAGDRLSTRVPRAFEAFRTRRPFAFNLPWWQQAADAASGVTAGALFLLLVAALLRHLRGKAFAS